jgi:hypothetical protein
MASILSQLNKEGRVRFWAIVGSALFAVAYLVVYLIFLASASQSGIYALALAVIFAVVPYAFHWHFYRDYQSRIRMMVLSQLGFVKEEGVQSLAGYAVAKHRESLAGFHKGQIDGHPFRLVEFAIIRGSGRNKEVFPRTGVEFITEKTHFPVQVYDNEEELGPEWKSGRLLESNDFHRDFTVHAESDRDPFFFLAPDAMSDLMQIKKDTGYRASMESIGDRILIYVKDFKLVKEFPGKVGFIQMLNCTIGDEQVQVYRTNVEAFLRQMLKIFLVLDYKIKTVEKM